jgi:hypothetical protein
LDTLSTGPGAGRPLLEHRTGVAKAALVTGGSFATAVGSVLAAAGVWGLGGSTILHALVALCVIASLTMVTAAFMTRR